MMPRLADLKPYFKVFSPAAPLWAGMLLASLTLTGSLGLVGLSGAFLAATALAGLTADAALFNTVVPAGAIRLFALMRAVSRWAERVVNHETTFGALGRLRVGLFEKLVRLSPRQVGQRHGADVLNRVTRDVDLLDNLWLRLLVPLAAASVVFVAAAIFAAGVPLLMLPVAGLVAVIVLASWALYRSARVLSSRLVQRHAALRSRVLDLTEDLDDTALHGPAWLVQRDAVSGEDGARSADHDALQRGGAAARAAVPVLTALTAFAVLALAGTGTGIEGPWLLALCLVVLGLNEALLALPQAWLELPGTALAARRLTELSSQEPQPRFAADGASGSFELVFEGVSFGYESEPVLDRVSFSVPVGTHVALMGPSGGGKTTLARLVTRLEDVASGRILLGGMDLKEWAEAPFRDAVTGTPQDAWALSASLADNLRLARADADDAALWRVLDAVGLGDQVRQWPSGLKTWIEEGGQSLSGGQRRRLSIAQALLRGAAVTVLDEPTEGLETEAARSLVTAVRAELVGRTLIWISHRPEGLDGFDAVWRLDGGKLTKSLSRAD
jgi:ATP-binding cassette subfamily C protein CydC